MFPSALSPTLQEQTFPIFSMLWNLTASLQPHNSFLAESPDEATKTQGSQK